MSSNDSVWWQDGNGLVETPCGPILTAAASSRPIRLPPDPRGALPFVTKHLFQSGMANRRDGRGWQEWQGGSENCSSMGRATLIGVSSLEAALLKPLYRHLKRRVDFQKNPSSVWL